MERAESLRRLAGARVARLATVGPGGLPRLVPICFAVEGGRLYSVVDAKPKRTTRLARLRDVEERGVAAVLVDHYDDASWGSLWWVRASGRARVVSEAAEAERAIELLVAKYLQYRERRPAGPVLALELDELTSWQASPPSGSGA